MRNLKKFLALVLALMMAMSLMVTANATITTDAAVTDRDSITEEFKEAVAVLNGLKIITGYEDGTFRPDKSISRQETTALIYRLHSGDVDDTRNNLYSTVDNIKQFTDVDPNGGQKWSAGYIGYCANQGIIKGVSDTRFAPTREVTGYQVLAMVLRAVGYGQNGEYEGTGWQTRVATTATKLGILDNVNNTNYAGTLSASATRELVAEIIFRASRLPTVTYTPALGYVYEGTLDTTGNRLSLSWKKFNLNCSNYTVIDKWGRPGYYWFKGSTLNSNLSNAVATIKVNPVKEYDITQHECDVAKDLGITTSETYRLYVNNNEHITDNYLIVATDTVTKVGGQGRITEFYAKLTHPYNTGNTWPASVVMVDTFLAKVTKVENEVLDAAGHQMIPAKLTLMVYDGYSETEDGTNTKGLPAGHTRVVTKASGNWEFVKGDFVTLNAYTNNDDGIDVNDKTSAHSGPDSNTNKAAFEAEETAVKTNTADTLAYAENITKAEPVLGKQTTIYWNQGKHNVDNEDKLDQLDLHLDVAGTTTNTTFAWYYDAKGNLIGIGNVPDTINYGIITSIYSSFKQGEGNTTGEAVAIATVKYADGTEGTVTIDRFLVNSLAGGTDWGHNTVYATDMLDAPSASPANNTTAGATELLPAYDYGTSTGPMTAVARTANAVAHAAQAATLYVAPVAGVNTVEEADKSTILLPWGKGTATTFTYGIIKGNLFKFMNSADGDVTAIEVAGTDNNTGIYKGHRSLLAGAGLTEMSKNYAYFTVATGTTIRMDNNTKIIVRGCKVDADGDFAEATDSITVYNGINELPANVVVADESEVDWADIDGNGIADVVYVYGVKKGADGYNLFYFNGSAGQWTGNAATGSGWLRGWLDGVQTDLTFTDKDLFDRVQQSTATYGGHLFAVKLLDGEVETLLGNDSFTNGHKDYFLVDPTWTTGNFTPNSAAVALKDLNIGALASVTNGITGTLSSNPAFQFGADNGNDYTDTGDGETSAIWLRDEPAAVTPGNHMNVVYNDSNNTIEVWCYTINPDGSKDLKNNSGSTMWATTVAAGADVADAVYNLSGTSARLGDALYFLNLAGRVNDVTIVFEAEAVNTIRQVYVTTRPDITAPGQGGDYTSPVTFGAGVTDLSNVDSITDNDTLEAYLQNIPGYVVATHNTYKYDSSAAPTELLYFPFHVPVSTSAGRVTLTIKDAASNLVYTEWATTPNTGGRGITNLDITNKTCTANGVWYGSYTGGLTAGTYSYEIVINADGRSLTVSNGTFTMN